MDQRSESGGEEAPIATVAVNRRRQREADYVGPPGKRGNPYAIGRDGDRAAVVARFRSHLARWPDLLAGRAELRGKRLGCWCKPLACHGDVLAEVAELDGAALARWVDAVLATEA